MKKLSIWFLTICFCFNQAFAMEGTPGQIKRGFKPVLISAYAKAYTKLFENTVKYYNDHRKDPKYFTKRLIRKEDKRFLSQLVDLNRLSSVPEIKHKNGVYYFQEKGVKISFDIVSIYKGLYYIDGKAFDFTKGESLREKALLVTKFLEENKIKTTQTNLLEDLFVPKAHAIICGGFCLTILIGGTVLAGATVYNMAMGVVGVDKKHGDLMDIHDTIKEESNQCQEDLEYIREYSSKTKTYNSTAPGTQKTFGLLKKFLDKEQDLNRSKIENYLYHTHGLSKSKTCKQFAEELYQGQDLQTRRMADAGTGSGKRSDQFQDEACKAYDDLADCLEEFYNVHRTHKGKKNIYNYSYDEELGTYDEDDAYSTSK